MSDMPTGLNDSPQNIVQRLTRVARERMNNQNNSGISKSARAILAKNLLRLRKAHGYGQQELADLSGLSKSFIGGLENARMNVSLDNLESLSRVLGVEVFVLLIPPDDPDPDK
ncbi:helix-turn-helix domain-containing protein [Sedimenticola thiotaurini]|nr:helix-turn-helix transcriptional regulator [Sedimenticola thiotaurini]